MSLAVTTEVTEGVILNEVKDLALDEVERLLQWMLDASLRSA